MSLSARPPRPSHSCRPFPRFSSSPFCREPATSPQFTQRHVPHGMSSAERPPVHSRGGDLSCTYSKASLRRTRQTRCASYAMDTGLVFVILLSRSDWEVHGGATRGRSADSQIPDSLALIPTLPITLVRTLDFRNGSNRHCLQYAQDQDVCVVTTP